MKQPEAPDPITQERIQAPAGNHVGLGSCGSEFPPQRYWKKICVYCEEPARGNKEHVFPKHVGYRLKIGITCTSCNQALGGDVDATWAEDHWVRLLEGGREPDPERPDRFVLRGEGQRVKSPYTDPGAFRAAAKIGFELFSFFIRDQIFHAAFDPWREYIREGEPDLEETGSLFRMANFPGRWAPKHELAVRPSGRDGQRTLFDLRLFLSYQFGLLTTWPFPWGKRALDIAIGMNSPILFVRVWDGNEIVRTCKMRVA